MEAEAGDEVEAEVAAAGVEAEAEALAEDEEEELLEEASYLLKTWRRVWDPTALFMAASSAGSTSKDSAMQLTATSMESLSSAVRVPSVVEVRRNSQMASARRCLGVCWAAWNLTSAMANFSFFFITLLKYIARVRERESLVMNDSANPPSKKKIRG